MGGQADEFVKELKALRRGYGIGTVDLKAHTGSLLSTAAGAATTDPADQFRRKVQTLIEELIGQLPEGARPLLLMAFGLSGNGEPGQPRYLARVEQFAQRQRAAGRTIQRRIDLAIEQMAELVSQARPRERPSARQTPWRTAGLKVFLSFDLAVPEAFEIRQVVALRDGLAELDLGMTLTPPAGWTGEGSLEDLGVDLLHGGQLTGRTMRSSNRIAFRLRLPATLGLSQRHEYALRVKLPAERGIAPHYVCTPNYECDLFELSIRFRTDSPPVRVWRVPGVLPLELDDAKVNRTLITPNTFGEVHETFTGLEPHLSYGVGWEPP